MSIATKKGDGGETALIFGTRVSKNNVRVWAYGGVDELNSAIGLARAHAGGEAVPGLLRELQHRLVPLMAELATDGSQQQRYLESAQSIISEADVEHLTAQIVEMEQSQGHFSGWEYPGDTVAQAFFDQARTTCRRAERQVVALTEAGETVRPVLFKFLNRLSDLLWLLGRAERVKDKG